MLALSRAATFSIFTRTCSTPIALQAFTRYAEPAFRHRNEAYISSRRPRRLLSPRFRPAHHDAPDDEHAKEAAFSYQVFPARMMFAFDFADDEQRIIQKLSVDGCDARHGDELSFLSLYLSTQAAFSRRQLRFIIDSAILRRLISHSYFTFRERTSLIAKRRDISIQRARRHR